MVDAVRGYGAAHPDQFGDVRVDGPRVVASFTSDLRRHLAALQQVVGDPDRIAVEPAKATGARLQQICDEVARCYGDDPRRVLVRTGPGVVAVRAPFEDVAAELHARYGAAIDITLGTKPYPRGRITPGLAVPAPVPVTTVEVVDLATVMELNGTSVRSGEDMRGRLRLVNRGAEPLRLRTGAIVPGGVRRPGTGFLAGWFVGAVVAVAVGIDLAPGAERTHPLAVGTTSCLPDDSYGVPPGRYETIAAFGVTVVGDPGPAGGTGVVVVTGPVVTVTA